MVTLVIGDLHFNDKPRGLLEAQVKYTKQIVDHAISKSKKRITRVVFLGDLMMHRRPTPSVLLALKRVVDYASYKTGHAVILRGNHDSETKADDGVTALSLFEVPNRVSVVIHPEFYSWQNQYYIPHYEDENRIKEELKKVPEGYTVFGHFGYNGALNSAGDSDFTLSPSDFTHNTILGHIHGYKQEGNITVLGTPFTTSFQESGKESFYGILDENNVLTVYNIDFGIRHIQIDYENVEENLYWINDSDYFTLLRINMSSIREDQESVSNLLDKLKVGYYEIKYKPLVDTKEEFTINEDREAVLDVNNDLIEEYINSSNSQIGKDELLDGLQIIYENQSGRDL